MSSKERTQRNDPSPSGQQAVRPEAQSTDIPPAHAAQQGRMAARLLTPGDVLQLQRTIGNRAVVQMIGDTDKRTDQASWRADEIIQRKIDDPKILEDLYTWYKQVAETYELNPYDSEIEEVIYKDIIENFDNKSLEAARKHISLLFQRFKELIDAKKKDKINNAWAAVQNQIPGINKHHAEDREMVKKALDQGQNMHSQMTDLNSANISESTEHKIRLANSCEFILNGGIKLFAVTKIYQDSKTRYYFPNCEGNSGDILSASKTLNPEDENLADKGFIKEGVKQAGGWRGKGYIAITDARKKPLEEIWKTIKHELQHETDNHRESNDLNWQSFQSPVPLHVNEEEEIKGWWQAYQTEFRAHWYQSEEDWSTDLSDSDEAYGYEWNAKQLKIFSHLYNGYKDVKLLWDWTMKEGSLAQDPAQKGAYANEYVDNKTKKMIDTMREKIVAYKNPDSAGFNKWNSIRIENFRQKLKTYLKPGGYLEQATRKGLKKAISELRPEELHFVWESRDYQAMIELAKHTAGQTVERMLRDRLISSEDNN